MRAIQDVAADLGLGADDLFTYGPHAAKVDLAAGARSARKPGRIVLVSAMTPTPAGEGKTTTSVAIADGLRLLGRRSLVCLRQPSLGPLFGRKGGGSGGGKAKLEPQRQIDVHFTGDLHAVTTAHDLLAAIVDNAVYYKDPAGPDVSKTTWRRVLDVNDRALRRISVGTKEAKRDSGFDITAASEVMAVLALAKSPEDLARRMSRIVVGATADDRPVTAGDLDAVSAMQIIMEQATRPNLVQTAEGTPAFVHAGPFANIAHGCSSVMATQLGTQLADDVITEAGFAFDLGGEKFLDLKCISAGIWPRLVVLVTTVRAVKHHGGGDLAKGFTNVAHHLRAIRKFGLEPIVAVNRFPDDSAEDLKALHGACYELGVRSADSKAYAEGAAGAVDLAKVVAEQLDASDAAPAKPQPSYEAGASLETALRAIAGRVYGSDAVEIAPAAQQQLERFAKWGYERLPVCVAKTHLSITDNPELLCAPEGQTLHVKEVRLSAGAGFFVALTGDILTMPGLPQRKK